MCRFFKFPRLLGQHPDEPDRPPEFNMKTSLSPLLAALLATAAPLYLGAEHKPTPEQSAFFKKEVKPILEKNCYRCHGGEDKLKGHFRITSREGILQGGDQGPAFNETDRPKSLLLAMISYKDGDHEMPPKEKLPQAQIDVLTKWVQDGLPFPPEEEIRGKSGHKGMVVTDTDRQHWAFQPVKKPDAPKVKDGGWARNGIDPFILSKLEKAGLQPSGPAAKATLIRRAYYDLIGLPPSPEEVQAFLQDNRPDAFEKIIDDLLKRPQYGEKWGRHWLDLVRYAETNGYERDSEKPEAWRYRDYVIRALNQDKPYNQFILEQLAGDELPSRSGDAIIATGFHRLGTWDDEPADRDLAKYDYLDDILRTTTETFLGLTVGCARCHDHKIDPIPTRDYYGILAFFHDISPHGKGGTNLIEVPAVENQAAFDEKVKKKAELEDSLRRTIGELDQRFQEKLKAKYPKLGLQAVPSPDSQQRGKDLYLLPDSRTSGQTWEYTFENPGDNWFEIGFDDSKWKKGPGGFGSSGTPNAHVRTNWNTQGIWLRKDFRLTTIPENLTLHIHHDEDVEIHLNGSLIHRAKSYTTNYIKIDALAKAEFFLQTGKNTLAVHCKQTGGGQYIDIGLSTDTSGGPDLVKLFNKYGQELLGEDAQKLKRAKRDLQASLAQKLENKTVKAMAVAERGRTPVHVLARGNPRLKGDVAPPGFLAVLGETQAQIPAEYAINNSSGKRRYLAEWIARPENQLTTRVIANRLWQFHFGRGIVRSSSDFGTRGDAPTHPQLLDWLAATLVEKDWSLKSMHKLILMSRTWQMASAPHDEALKKDPLNHLFWRYDMRRLTAEEIRDSILNLTGELNLKMGGPSITPPLPQEVLATSSRPGAAWRGLSDPENAARRSVYVKIKRSLKMPLLLGHDMADTDGPCAVRFNTTVPTQALTMLNSELISKAASTFARRLLDNADNNEDRVREAFRVAFCREPSANEVKAGTEMIDDIRTQSKLTEAQAIERFALLTLNLNEFVYLD